MSDAAVPGPTGHPVVDEVLGALDGLEARPLDQHVPAFEAAHERLRDTLSGTTAGSAGAAPVA